MPIRTTDVAVKAILRSGASMGSNYDGETSLTPFIEAASSIVDRVSTYATNNSLTITAVQLELLERWLSAWAYALTDIGYTSESEGGASASFQGQTGMHYEANYYGQMALALDPIGALLAMRKKGSVTFVGKLPRERIYYYNR